MGECDVEPDHGCSIGVHPKYLLTDSLREKLVEAIRKLPPKDIFCIGEVGLDFQVYSVTIANQRKQLKIFVKLAKELKLPLQLHARSGGNGSAPMEILDVLGQVDPERELIHYWHFWTGTCEVSNCFQTSNFCLQTVQEFHLCCLNTNAPDCPY